jgi:hypothetical protein
MRLQDCKVWHAAFVDYTLQARRELQVLVAATTLQLRNFLVLVKNGCFSCSGKQVKSLWGKADLAAVGR